MTILPAVNSNCRKLLTCLHCHAIRQNRFAQTLSHYEILGLKESASRQQIKDSFIKLSKQFHPDSATKGENKHDRFIKISEAYNILSSPETRQTYDSSLTRHTSPVGFTSGYGRSGSPQPSYQAGDWAHGAPHITLTEEELAELLADKRNRTFWHGEDRSGHKIPMYVHVTCIVVFACLMGMTATACSVYSKRKVRQKQQLLVEKRRKRF